MLSPKVRKPIEEFLKFCRKSSQPFVKKLLLELAALADIEKFNEEIPYIGYDSEEKEFLFGFIPISELCGHSTFYGKINNKCFTKGVVKHLKDSGCDGLFVVLSQDGEICCGIAKTDKEIAEKISRLIDKYGGSFVPEDDSIEKGWVSFSGDGLPAY